ncbi:Proline-rich receptor-like protein kinase PERK1 [Rhynchospora pubera]|uniref:non-specific serine/threonine protein kinase n=1 Tax=Rhynchospora pubera TaxID=906938 RepID=A0AAV8DV79_9POAL|nr:Proline-rich receptor-like protein kinase PERK1 [Rhynchospora pubera]
MGFFTRFFSCGPCGSLVGRRYPHGAVVEDTEEEEIVFAFPGNKFTLEELRVATNDFCENIVSDTYISMYKGWLADGRDVAVGLFSKNDAALRCFVAEMNILSHLHHRNVVMLIGHCVNNEQMITVYEYAANRSLAFYLGEKAGSNLDWPTRYKIAHGFGKGLAYLHEDCHPRIVHGDIKPSNVLLTDSFEPKIAGFGFSTFLKDDEIDATVAIVGSSGYVDPEYLCSGRLTEKSDVFSFGVVLLQIITGKEPVIEQWY